MSVHVSLRHAPAGAAATPASGAAPAVPAPVVATLGLSALWVALASALALVTERGFGMTAAQGWAFGLSIVTYIYVFVGFIAGVITAVRREGEPT